MRIKELAKAKGISMQDLSKKLGITYQSLNKRLVALKFETLKEISEKIDCDIHELIEPGEKYAHFYDQQTGEWLGIRKK